MSKKVSYVKMLKEAISEWDTSKTVDVKGPMLDPILSYKGDGELPTNKDAASILERYYFDEGREQGIEEADYEIDTGKIADSPAMKHTEGPGGEEQAGTADAKTIEGAKDEKEEDIVKEWVLSEEDEKEDEEEDEKEEVKEQEEPAEKDEEEEGEEVEEQEIMQHLLSVLREQDHDEDKETPEDEKKESPEMQAKEKEEGTEKHVIEQEEEKEDEDEEEVKEDVEMENAIIEKLISEMEGDGDDFYGGDFEDAMEEEGGSPEEDSPSMKHTEGPGGEEQAGTGDADTQIPDREDIHDKVVEPPDLKEARDIIASLFEQEASEEEEPEEKELDVDKEVKKEAAAPSAFVGGPSPHKKGEDWDLEEAFKLFREEIEDEEEPEEKDEKVKVEKIDPRRLRV